MDTSLACVLVITSVKQTALPPVKQTTLPPVKQTTLPPVKQTTLPPVKQPPENLSLNPMSKPDPLDPHQ